MTEKSARLTVKGHDPLDLPIYSPILGKVILVLWMVMHLRLCGIPKSGCQK